MNASNGYAQTQVMEAEKPVSYSAIAGRRKKISTGQNLFEILTLGLAEFYLIQFFFLNKYVETACVFFGATKVTEKDRCCCVTAA
jgi:hypothetical protein